MPARTTSAAAGRPIAAPSEHPVTVPSQDEMPPAGLRSGMGGPDIGGARVEVPWSSRRAGAEGVTHQGQGVQVVQPSGAPPGPPTPGAVRGKLADATG